MKRGDSAIIIDRGRARDSDATWIESETRTGRDGGTRLVHVGTNNADKEGTTEDS